jgi:mono/diheme cytochrome c family protein
MISRLASARRGPALCLLILTAALSVSFAAEAQARERGSQAFQTKGCLRCHSITGVGGKRAPDLGSVGLRRSPAQIRRQIERGGHGMPPFGGVLSRHDISDLVEFLRSCRTDDAPGCRDWEAPAVK